MGALAASLLCMVSRITLGRKEPTPHADRLNRVLKEGEDLRQRLLRLVVDDADAFDAVMKAYTLSKDQPEARRKAIQNATVKAAEVPLSTLELSVGALRLALDAAEVGSSSTLSDVTTAVAAARAAVEGAASNVLINLPSIEDKPWVEKTKARVTEFWKETLGLSEKVEKLVQSRSRRED